MRQIIKKLSIISLTILVVIITINYFIDPANLFHDGIIIQMVRMINENKTIVYPHDIDEGEFKKEIIETMRNKHDTVIMGSSHIMYTPFDFDDYIILGVSGAGLGDYYGIIGELDYYNKLPNRMVLGIDTWITETAFDGGRLAIKPFAKALYNKIHSIENEPYNDNKNNIEKMYELISFPYFQSSLRNIRRLGITYYFNSENRTIKEAESLEALPINHLLTPECRLIMSKDTYWTNDAKDNAVLNIINNDTIYGHKKGLFNIDENNYTSFLDLINYLQNKGIEIIFYLPSHYPKVWDYIESESKYKNFILIEERLRDFAKKNNIVVHGTYNPYVAGINKEDFADNLHMRPEVMIKNFNFIK